MADLSRDLQNYLSRNEKSTNNTTISFKTNLSSLTPDVSKWFLNSQDSKSTEGNGEGWVKEAQNDPLLPSLSKRQRIVGFVGFLLMGIFCFILASLYIPFLILKARKFALLYTLGSLFIVSSFAILWGPINHLKHLFSPARLPFTTAYFGSMFATLYFALEVRSTPLTVVFAILQIIALVWYLTSYIPGGQTGLKYFTKMFSFSFTKTVQKTLPV